MPEMSDRKAQERKELQTSSFAAEAQTKGAAPADTGKGGSDNQAGNLSDLKQPSQFKPSEADRKTAAEWKRAADRGEDFKPSTPEPSVQNRLKNM